MTIHQLAEKLNLLAIENEFEIASLPALRKRYLNKQKLPHKIFSGLTIKDEDAIYAFHHGGRDEMQFNVGEEFFDGDEWTRFALCFSLEPSPSLTDPIGTLHKFRKNFDKLVQSNPSLFDGFDLWYHRDGERLETMAPGKIPDNWFEQGNFICLGSMLHKSYANLAEVDLETIMAGFDRLLPIYKYCVLGIAPKRKIFTRLTSNDNFWELPSGHAWSKKNQGNGSIPFENQHGFGGEEWLLNKRYSARGYQYGFIRGIMTSRDKDDIYSEVHLYTVKKSKQVRKVFYVGYIKDCIVIKNDEVEQALINGIIGKFESEQVAEVAAVNGDFDWFSTNPFKMAVKFRPKDVHILDEPVYQPNFPLGTYKRFIAYPLDKPLVNIFDRPVQQPKTIFRPGKASQTGSYTRSGKTFSVTIERVHSEIVEALKIYLGPSFSVSNKKLSIETTHFHLNTADVVTHHGKNEIVIYEIKTSLSGRRNIREALAQLLDYASHSDELKVKKLVIVSPAKLGDTELLFLAKINEILTFKVEYLWFNREHSSKFIKQG